MGISKNEFLLPIILAVLVTTGVALYALKPKNDILINQIPGVKLIDGTPAPTPEEATAFDQDGVYKNTKYGFELKYPKEIFKDKDIEGQFPDEGLYSYYLLEKSSGISSKPKYRFEIYAYKYGDYDKTSPGHGPTLYFDAIKRKDREAVYQFDKKSTLVPVGYKISESKTQEYSRVYYQYVEQFEDNAIGSNILSSDWLKGNIIITVRVSSDKASIESFKPTFQKIIDSFKFIEQ